MIRIRGRLAGFQLVLGKYTVSVFYGNSSHSSSPINQRHNIWGNAPVQEYFEGFETPDCELGIMYEGKLVELDGDTVDNHIPTDILAKVIGHIAYYPDMEPAAFREFYLNLVEGRHT